MSDADREAILAALGRLAASPGRADLRKLEGTRDEWAIRVGRWRILARLDNAAGLIYVRRVLPRRDAYRS